MSRFVEPALGLAALRKPRYCRLPPAKYSVTGSPPAWNAPSPASFFQRCQRSVLKSTTLRVPDTSSRQRRAPFLGRTQLLRLPVSRIRRPERDLTTTSRVVSPEINTLTRPDLVPQDVPG